MNIYGIVRKTKNIYNKQYKLSYTTYSIQEYTNKRRLCLTFVIILLITFKMTIVGVRSE